VEVEQHLQSRHDGQSVRLLRLQSALAHPETAHRGARLAGFFRWWWPVSEGAEEIAGAR